MTCMGHYEIKPFKYKKFLEKNKFTYSMLENVLMYLYQASNLTAPLHT